MVRSAAVRYADRVTLPNVLPREDCLPFHSSIAALCVGFHMMTAFGHNAVELARAEQVSLAVRFRLTDLEYRPISDACVRVALGTSESWQPGVAGKRFTTDHTGEHQFEMPALLERRTRKRPTNFIDSLLSRPQPTQFLAVGAELEYAGHRWLYVLDLHRFRCDGDMLLDGMAIYCADERGDFTQPATFKKGHWLMPDRGGFALSTPGHEAWEFMLKPDDTDAAGSRWNLDLAFKRWPSPVRR